LGGDYGLNQQLNYNMTNKTKQTAVDILFNRFLELFLFQEGISPELEDAYKHAKEIEKIQQEQLSSSWAKSREQAREVSTHIGFASGFISGLKCYEDYYSELEKTDLDEDKFTNNYIVDEFEQTFLIKNK